MPATAATRAPVSSSAPVSLIAPVSSSAAATPPATAESVSSERLPQYVTAHRSTVGRTSYVVRGVPIDGHKGSVYLGLLYADAQSASLAARAFKSSASVDPATGNITLNDTVLQRYTAQMCSMYRVRSMNIDKVCVVVVLRAILKRLACRNSKRKRDSKTDGDSGAAAAASGKPECANEVAALPTAAAAALPQPKRAKTSRFKICSVTGRKILKEQRSE